MYFNFLTKILSCFFIVLLFYKYIKSIAYRYAGNIAVYLGFTKFHSYEVAKGFVELMLIVIAHVVFCIILFHGYHLTCADLGIRYFPDMRLIAQGALLGVGVMGASSLLGRMYIELMKFYSSHTSRLDTKNWLTMARGGWIRHHYHTIQVLPIPVAIMVTLGQVFAEELVFRGVFVNVFLPWGIVAAVCFSTLFFMLMQVFYMPNRIASIFPVIGALVVGVINSYLFIATHNLYPLIVAHIVFFTFAVL